jgi:hypothetical protein
MDGTKGKILAWVLMYAGFMLMLIGILISAGNKKK